MVLTIEKASNGDDAGEETDQSYTPSLVKPFKRITIEQSSCQEKKKGKTSIDTLLDMQNWEIEIRFFFMLGP